MNQDKKRAVNYLMYRYIQWYKTENPNEENNISRLKFLLLLFLTCATELSRDSEDTLADIIFNKFESQPFGIIEAEVKEYLKDSVDIDNRKIINYFIETYPSPKILQKLDEAVDKLRHINKNIINYSALDLVAIHQNFYSYRLYMKKAKDNKLSSHNIPTEEFKKEGKIYQL